MKIYGIKACDTCRKAVKELGGELRDVRDNPLTKAELSRFLHVLGEELVNKRSTTWRGLAETERNASTVDLIARYPTLMKRPVIEKDGILYLGWGSEVKAELL